GEAVGAPGELVVDVGSGHHGPIALGFVAILDALQEPLPPLLEEPAVTLSPPVAVAFPDPLGDSGRHSKASEVWSNEDVLLPQLFQKLRGFSSSFPKFRPKPKNITLV